MASLGDLMISILYWITSDGLGQNNPNQNHREHLTSSFCASHVYI
jgi:hypothetical protein